MAVDHAGAPQHFSFPPGYGEQSDAILREVGYDAAAIAALHAKRAVAGPEAVSRKTRSA
jgi:hypothetical protein